MTSSGLPEFLEFPAAPPPAVRDDDLLIFPAESELPPPRRSFTAPPSGDFPIDPEPEDVPDILPEDYESNGESESEGRPDVDPAWDDFPVDELPDYDF